MIQCDRGYLRFSAGPYSIVWLEYTPNHIKIGCQRRTIRQWEKLSDRFGLRYGYTKEQVTEVRKVIQVLKGLRDAIQ